MKMEKLHVCIVLYFQQTRSQTWPQHLREFAIEIAQSFKVGLTQFSCDYKGDETQIKKNKAYQYSARNLARLDAAIEGGTFLSSIGFQYAVSKDNIRDADLVVEIQGYDYWPYQTMYMEFPVDWLDGGDMTHSAQSLISLVMKSDAIVDIQYGLITAMDQHKMPFIYFGDFGVATINREENLNLGVWMRKEKRAFYRTKLRAIYWGNLLGAGHLTATGDMESFKQQLLKIVGIGGMTVFPNQKVFFQQPETDEKVRKLEELLDKYDLLIHPDGTEGVPGYALR